MTFRRVLTTALALSLGSALAAQREVTLNVPGATLSGTLQTPDTARPGAKVPVALILPGSGPTNRDGDSAAGPGGTYRKLAASLAARGIATLRADKRGIGKSVPADPREEALSFTDYVNDARAWVNWLAAQPGLGPVALIGHSEGGLIALAALQEPAPVQALVLLAAPGESLGATIRRQIGQNPANPPALVEESNRILAALERGESVAEVSPVLAPLFRPSVQPYLKSSLGLDPARLIAAVKVPTLIVQGARDLQVRVQDAELLRAAQPAAQLQLVPGMNHVLVDVPLDMQANAASYADPNKVLAPALTLGVGEFLRAQLR